jgi:hypothetical protein
MTSIQDMVNRIKKVPQVQDGPKEIITVVYNEAGCPFNVSNLNPIPSDDEPAEAFTKYNMRQGEIDMMVINGRRGMPSGWRFKPRNTAMKKLIQDVKNKTVNFNLKSPDLPVNRQVPACLQGAIPEVKEQKDDEEWEPQHFIADFPFKYGKEEKETMQENFHMVQKPTFDAEDLVKKAKAQGAKSSQLSLLAREAGQVEKKLIRDYEDKISENLEERKPETEPEDTESELEEPEEED